MRSYLRPPVLVAVLVALSLATSACSKDEPTPAEARRNRLETRLQASFPDAQAKCIMGKLDEPTIVALDRTATLAPGQALDRYSDAVRACVADPATTTEATSTTSAATTAPTAASTTVRSGTTTPAAGATDSIVSATTITSTTAG